MGVFVGRGEERWLILTKGGGDKNRQGNGDVQLMQVALLSSIDLCEVQVVSLAWKVQDPAGTSCRMSEMQDFPHSAVQ